MSTRKKILCVFDTALWLALFFSKGDWAYKTAYLMAFVVSAYLLYYYICIDMSSMMIRTMENSYKIKGAGKFIKKLQTRQKGHDLALRIMSGLVGAAVIILAWSTLRGGNI